MEVSGYNNTELLLQYGHLLFHWGFHIWRHYLSPNPREKNLSEFFTLEIIGSISQEIQNFFWKFLEVIFFYNRVTLLTLFEMS